MIKAYLALQEGDVKGGDNCTQQVRRIGSFLALKRVIQRDIERYASDAFELKAMFRLQQTCED
jgi:hypothetical protein